MPGSLGVMFSSAAAKDGRRCGAHDATHLFSYRSAGQKPQLILPKACILSGGSRKNLIFSPLSDSRNWLYSLAMACFSLFELQSKNTLQKLTASSSGG